MDKFSAVLIQANMVLVLSEYTYLSMGYLRHLGYLLGIPALLFMPVPLVSYPQACRATMFQCVHFWGWKVLEHTPGSSSASVYDQIMAFQNTLCSVMVRTWMGFT